MFSGTFCRALFSCLKIFFFLGNMVFHSGDLEVSTLGIPPSPHHPTLKTTSWNTISMRSINPRWG